MFDVKLFNEYRYIMKMIYFNKCNIDYGTTYKCDLDLDCCYSRMCEINDMNPSIAKEYKNLLNRNNRLNKRIKKICEFEQPVFLTLTFSDESLANTSAFYRRKQVSYFLKRNCSCYVANIDFGKAKGREHYHAVVSNVVNYDDWIYGLIDGIKIYKESNALSMYIAKLSHHALKDSTDLKQHCIYSRG